MGSPWFNLWFFDNYMKNEWLVLVYSNSANFMIFKGSSFMVMQSVGKCQHQERLARAVLTV